MKNWTTKEIQYLKNNALLAETNVVLNVDQMAKKLGRTAKSVDTKIYKLRRDGQFPATDFSKSFDPRGRRFTTSEDQRIIAMYKQGASYKEIGENLDRAETSIGGRIVWLKKHKKLKPTMHQRNWTQEEIDILLTNIKFDENGFCCNHTELARLCKRTYEQVIGKICRLRRSGVLSQKPDKTKTSVKSKQAMNQFNEVRFAQYRKKEDKPVEPREKQTSEIISVESREVSLILTTVNLSDRRIDQYYTKDGQLIAVKKEPTSLADEVSR